MSHIDKGGSMEVRRYVKHQGNHAIVLGFGLNDATLTRRRTDGRVAEERARARISPGCQEIQLGGYRPSVYLQAFLSGLFSRPVKPFNNTIGLWMVCCGTEASVTKEVNEGVAKLWFKLLSLIRGDCRWHTNNIFIVK